MRILKRLNLVSLLIAVIVTLAGYAVWKSHFAKYRAHARLQIMQEVPRLLFRTVDNDNANEYKRYQRTQQLLVTSKLVLVSALLDGTISRYRMLREQTDPVAWLREALEVEIIGDSEVMEIALRGDSPDEVAGLVNAVKKAYIDEIVAVETKRRADRHEQLRKIKETYQERLTERRKALRKLSQTGESDDPLRVAGLGRPELLRLRHDLWTQRGGLQLERAEAETLLVRRRKSAGAETDSVGKEIAQLEDQLAALTAQEKVLNDQLKETADEIWKSANQELALEPLKAEIAVMEETYRKVVAEVEARTIELGVPPRVRLIEDAVVPRTREDVTIFGW
jgi:uncharacterized protein involved in exopolysaccharide biosynthesis